MKFVNLIIAILISISLSSQSIAFSEEIGNRDMRYYDYFKLGTDDYLLFYEDGRTLNFHLFDSNLSSGRIVAYNIEQGRIFEGICIKDSIISIFYTGRSKNGFSIMLDNYSKELVKLDTTKILSTFDKRPISSRYKFVTSDNDRFSLLYAIDRDKLFILSYDHNTNIVVHNQLMQLPDKQIVIDFNSIHISDNGDIIMSLVNYGQKKDDYADITFLKLENGLKEIEEFVFKVNDFYIQEISSRYDNVNNQLVIAGFQNSDPKNGYEGTYYINFNSDNHVLEINKSAFPKELWTDLFGQSYSKKQIINEFRIKNLLLRSDGGAIIIGEQYREFERRRSTPTFIQSDVGMPMRGFVDYYYDDLILFSLDSEGHHDWYKVLYKKQFSQDDGGIYSSYYPMLTPRRLHILFNDEIKKSNTISEYLLSPSGAMERNSVLNTEYKDLQIRMKDAKQVASDEIIVPSEKNFKISLVKIKW